MGKGFQQGAIKLIITMKCGGVGFSLRKILICNFSAHTLNT